jgi:hypothetical protein
MVTEETLSTEKQTFWRKVWEWIVTHMRLLTFIATVVMFGVAIYSLIQANRTQKQTKEIVKSMPTRYIGRFPSTMDVINEFIDNAKKSIVIFTDVVAYGFFSEPEQFHKTMTLLRDKSKKIPVTLVVYNSEFYRKEILPMLFLGQPSISACELLSQVEKDSILIQNKGIRKKYDYFQKYDYSNSHIDKTLEDLDRLNICRDKCWGKKDFDSIDSEMFLDCIVEMIKETEIILKTNREYQADKKGIEIIHIGQEHKMFCWLIDGRKAIFGFPSNIDFAEIQFTTMDSELIQVMRNMVDYYRKHKDELAYKPHK